MMRLRQTPIRGVTPNQEAHLALTRLIERVGLNRRSFLVRLADLGYAFSDDDFVNWGRAGRSFPRDWGALSAMIEVVTRDQPPDRRCTAGEALEFLARTGMPFAELPALAALYSPAEFNAALTTYLPSAGTPAGAPRGSLASIHRRRDDATTGQFAGAGLLALAELVRSPAAHDAVVAFRAVFRSACDQIGVLAACKHLHELFQQLEDRYYLIYHDGRRLPGDLSAWTSVERLEPDLQAVIDELLEQASSSPLAGEALLWQQKLVRAQEELREAIERQELDLLRLATIALRDVLGREPSRINTRLVSAAGALRLSAVAQALGMVRDHLSALHLNQQAQLHVEAFARGVDALAELDARLTDAIAAHNTFQELDDELRRIEAILDPDLREIERAWQSLRPMMRRLCESTTATWAPKFGAIGDELERTLPSHNRSKILRLFRSYRSQAIRSFNQVDRDLLALCEELRKVGDPLETVLKMVA